jgi:L-seryl-tRNA(Ser) seleniumtransferase
LAIEMIEQTAAYRALPQVEQLCAELLARGETSMESSALTSLVRQELASYRAEIATGKRYSREEIVEAVAVTASRLEAPRLAPIINATGVIIHTNLGRAPVSEETVRAMATAAGQFVPLELDPSTNQRGGRLKEISGLMRVLTGAESTLVVNNNAAAVLLTLSALASGRSVLVSRGEAVEIGGGFRIPDMMTQSGASIVDVGTTNRTYPRDYERAIDASTALLLKVHASNFALEGFVRSTTVAELAPIAANYGIPLIDDIGSGAIIDPAPYGLTGERTIASSLADGASVVMASGDKILGGPQAGIIAGARNLIEQIETHPLARAVRADKVTLAGLAETLRHYSRGEAVEKIPVWQMITAKAEKLQRRASRIAEQLDRERVSVIEVDSTLGGGAAPGSKLKSWAVRLEPSQKLPAEDLAKRCRLSSPGLFGRIEHDALLLDLRTIAPDQDQNVVRVLQNALLDP